MPNRWVDYVKKFAADNNLSYGCALSKPECKETYRAKYGVTKKLTKKQNIEKMGAEDFRSKMVATQEKKKKVLASLPKPKPEPEQIIAPVKTKTQLQKITIGKKKYYLDPRNNALYESAENVKKKIKAGIWNAETNTIEEILSKSKIAERNMMGAEDIRSKMVATQEKKKKVLASLPKPKAEPEPAPKKVTVSKFTHNGVLYYKSKDNVLYDTKTKEEIGIWDPVTETIDYEDDDDDEEDEDEETQPPPKPKFTAKQIKEMKFRQQTLDLPDEMKREILGFLPSFTEKDADRLENIFTNVLDFNSNLLDMVAYNIRKYKLSSKLKGTKIIHNLNGTRTTISNLKDKIEDILQKNEVFNEDGLYFDVSSIDYDDLRKVGFGYEDNNIDKDINSFNIITLDNYIPNLFDKLTKYEKEITEIGNKKPPSKPIK